MKHTIGLILLFCSLHAFAQEANPIIGNWKLNIKGSQFAGSPPQMELRQYRVREDGYLVGLAIWVDERGDPGFLQFTARSDGNFYPEYDSSNLSDMQASKQSTPRTYAEKILSPTSIEWTDKYQDRVIASGIKSFSNQEKMSILVNSPNRAAYTLVYDKQ